MSYIEQVEEAMRRRTRHPSGERYERAVGFALAFYADLQMLETWSVEACLRHAEAWADREARRNR